MFQKPVQFTTIDDLLQVDNKKKKNVQYKKTTETVEKKKKASEVTIQPIDVVNCSRLSETQGEKKRVANSYQQFKDDDFPGSRILWIQ